jgi:hypothetical protein
VSVALRPADAGGQGQAEEGLPGEPPRGGLHRQQLRHEAPRGLPRGQQRQGEDPQDHVHIMAHAGPMCGFQRQVTRKLHRRQGEQQQQCQVPRQA